MSDTKEVTSLLAEIRDLLYIMAEPQLAIRDRAWREKIKEIVGASSKRRETLFLIDGTRTPSQIVSDAPLDRSNVYRFITELKEADLCSDEEGKPKLRVRVDERLFVEEE